MIVFTVMGVLWFWLICFEIGYGLGWLANNGGVFLAVGRFVLCATGVERAMDDTFAFYTKWEVA